MGIVVTALDPADEVGVRHAFDIRSRVDAADLPDFPPLVEWQFRASMREPWPGERHAWALAWLDDVPVGFLEMSLPFLENTGTADVRLEVSPDHRRRGVGRALLAHAEQVGRADGRKTLIATTVHALPGGPARSTEGEAFARSCGATLALTDVRRRLSVSDLSQAALDGLVSAAWAKAAGYSLVRWRGSVPDEFLADVAYLDGRLLSDAPLGDLAYEAQKIDGDRFRAQEATRAARGRVIYSTGARHDATGRLVAVTTIDVNEAVDWHAFQQITLVDPDHRGHRLGVLVKVDNLRTVLGAAPALRAIDTWNAAVNTHMIAINEEMGFRPVDGWHNWQITL
ncbi:GNAT family N-acetyltransferase [Asanoa sp. NPDC050611]|uniref:GNAT family N-acetyltransferase n=1 Tax=Asanoa sp. NPDC050611 TaxID=3157098 RepID=UPI00340AE3B0